MGTKSWLSLLAVTSLTYSLSTAAFANTLPYTDIGNSFAQAAIVNLTAAGDIHGYANGTFEPNQMITRGQFLAYMMNTLQPYTGVKPAATGTTFSDVLPGNWDYSVVSSAQSAGWINPYWIDVSKGFDENNQASRGDVASFFVAALEHSSFHLQLPEGTTPLTFATDSGLFYGLPASANPIYLNRANAAVVLQNMQTLCEQETLHETMHIGPGATGTTGIPIVMGFNYGGTITSDLTEDEQDTAINTVVYDGFHLDSSMQFQGSLPASFADSLHAVGKQVWALFGADQPTLLTQALTSATNRAALVTQIVQMSSASQVDGANIDFEDVPANLESDLTMFMQELTTALHAKGMQSSIDVTVPSAGSYSAAYNYGALGQTVNDVFLMTYDESWSGDTTPGPVTSLSWVQGNVTTLLQDGVPANRLVLGIPLYTRAWQTNNTSQSQSIPLSTMESMIASGQAVQSTMDATTDQSVDVYTDSSGIQWEFWQDGPNMLNTIGSLAVQDQLAGIGYWQLGDETASEWTTIIPSGLAAPSN